MLKNGFAPGALPLILNLRNINEVFSSEVFVLFKLNFNTWKIGPEIGLDMLVCSKLEKKRSTSLSYFKFVDIRMQKDVQVRCPAAWQLRSMAMLQSLQSWSVVDRKVARNQPLKSLHRVTVLHDFVYTTCKCPSTGCM